MSIPRLPQAGQVVLAVLDIQEKLIPRIQGRDELVAQCATLCRGVEILGGRIVVTEQYVKGLGPTIAPIREAVSNWRPIEKRSFSACGGGGEFEAAIGNPSPENFLLIAGIETHVCVMQTVLDTLEMGWRVGVVADAVGSRADSNYRLALKRMKALGVTLFSTEMALFELMRTSAHPRFKDVLALVK